MGESPLVIFGWGLIPMVISIFGGWLATLYTPSQRIRNYIQHFVAGIVLGAAAIELLPKIIGGDSPWTVVIGFAIGVVLMLILETFSKKMEDRAEASPLPIGLIAAAAIDLLIDGLLIGISFIGGLVSGIVIALSLSFCGFFLNISVVGTLAQKGIEKKGKYLSIGIISIMLPIGALIGGIIISHLPYAIMTETLALGVAALLYLGAEELLSHAHEEKDTITSSALLFLGFLAILIFRA